MPSDNDSLYSAISHQMSVLLPFDTSFNELVSALKADVENSFGADFVSSNMCDDHFKILDIICNLIMANIFLWENNALVKEFIPNSGVSLTIFCNILLHRSDRSVHFNSLVFSNKLHSNQEDSATTEATTKDI